MLWKHRRHKPWPASGPTAWLFICLACDLVLLFGNLLLLHDGFVDLYDSTFTADDAEKNTVRHYTPPIGGQQGNHVSRTLSDDSIHLPDAALTANVHLQRLLLHNQHNHNTESSGPRVISVSPTHLRQTLTQSSHCADIIRKELIALGWTKAVYKASIMSGEHNGTKVAIKTINKTGYDVDNCIREHATPEQCYSWAENKILKEIVLLQGLQHPHVVKVIM